MEFKIGDMLVFKDKKGYIYQDCVCDIKYRDEIDCYEIECNKFIVDVDVKMTIIDSIVGFNTFDKESDCYIGYRKDFKLKEIWTKTDEDVYKKVWELRSLEEYEYTMNYFYKEYQRDIELGCDEVDLAKSRRAYEQAKKEYEQAKKIWENK